MKLWKLQKSVLKVENHHLEEKVVVENYNYRRPGPQLQTSYFTNLIWRSTVKVGIGIVKSDSSFYICLIFFLSGNVQRRFRDNVARARYHLIKILNNYIIIDTLFSKKSDNKLKITLSQNILEE
uniref:SCP domain-containing protein n=1 Tax=Strongyloides papillosus TaxID=174720 RepID=A0A0N5CID2_STREA